MNTLAFLLGREPHLSKQELFSIFPDIKTVYEDEGILITDSISKEAILEVFSNIGGTIQVIEITHITSNESEVQKHITGTIVSTHPIKKVSFGISSRNHPLDNQRLGIQIKKDLKKHMISSRVINKDRNNIAGPLFEKEKLIQNETGFWSIKWNNNYYIGHTIAIQNINEYAKRDMKKGRDMNVGMLPPKLAQMMINFATDNKKDLSVYDPFCGLGTVLIEALHAGFRNVYGSDIAEKMVRMARDSVQAVQGTATTDIVHQDARFIHETPIPLDNCAIVTEGYLGQVLTEKSISRQNIDVQIQALSKIYYGFFSGLHKKDFAGRIVISFPFWRIKDKFIHFEEIENIFKKSGFKVQKPSFEHKRITTRGSMLYMRPNQTVGREIYILQK